MAVLNAASKECEPIWNPFATSVDDAWGWCDDVNLTFYNSLWASATSTVTTKELKIVLCTKGQLISEWLFGVSNFPKKKHEKIDEFLP